MQFIRGVLLSGVVALSGCNQVKAVFTPTEEKINAAFPLQDTIKVAHSALMSSLDSKPQDLKSVSEQYAKLMGARALTCTAKTSIGRMDTVSVIRAKVLDSDCFQKQDARLMEWIGLQRLSLALSRPALVPSDPFPEKALLPNFSDYSGQATFATEANVLVVKGAQRYTALQLPSGKVIATLAVPEQTYRAASLSANGHVLAVPVGSRNLRMIEVETGNLLWSTEEYSELIAWLPQVQAAVITEANSGVPQLLDTKNGRIDPFPATEKRITWAMQEQSANGKYLVGGGQTVSQMTVIRTPQGLLEAAPLQQWRLVGGSISTSTAFLIANGTKLVYQTGQDLGWLNLETQQQGLWQLSAINAYAFAKLNERSILFDARPTGADSAGTRVLDTENGTVALAKNVDVRDGSLISLYPRSGYLRRSDSSVTLGTSVDTEAPQSLERLVSSALLAKELAKVSAMSAGGEVVGTSNPDYEAYAKQVRAMNVANAIRDGLPRDVIESIRKGTTGSGQRQAQTGTPLLTDVPSNARVVALGVYEGTISTPNASGSRRPGSVRINVLPGSAPLVLVLTSYEPVNWLVSTNGRKISKILVSGYHDSNVIGTDGIPIIKIGSKYAYKMDSNEYALLKQDVARYLANPIQLFQGTYTGREFSVN